MVFSTISAACLVASTVLATTANGIGAQVIAYVTVAINAAMLVTNALIEIYRKWRDRDSDLTDTATTSTDSMQEVDQLDKIEEEESNGSQTD